MSRTQARRRSPSRTLGGRASWAIVAVLAVAVVGGLIVAFATNRGEGGAVATGAGVSHVHGLGVNPGDGDLYAATHHGVFRIPDDGGAELVSVPRDTMGFTVVGADHFLGSGHPAFQGDPLLEEGTPPVLGLIESTDAGKSWKARSLFGEVDFHALHAAHGEVFGFDGATGRFLVSGDRERWEVRAEGVMMSDFAIDPASADRLVAMTDNGLAESDDGGRSWAPTDGPDVVFLSWSAEQGLWGVDPQGHVFTRTADTWEERSALPGTPQALLAHDDALYAAVSGRDGTGIFVSDDGGSSWQLRYQDGE